MEIQESTGVRVVSPKVLPHTLSHRDDSIASLTKSILRLKPPLRHLKHDVLKHFLYHLIYYTACVQTSINLILSLCTGSKLLNLTLIKMHASINNHIDVYICMEKTLTDF